MALFNVLVDIAARTAGFEQGVKRAEDKLTTFERNVSKTTTTLLKMTGIGVSVAALYNFASSSLAAADALGDAAEKAGQTAETFSRLKHIAKQSDVEFESLATGVRKFQDNLSNATLGSAEAGKAFDALRLNAAHLKGLTLEQQLGEISDAFRQVKDPTDQTRIAIDLFGKSGADLIPLLNKGSSGMKELAEEADRLGITLDNRTVKSIDRSSKALDKFWESARGRTANYIGTAIADTFGSGDELLDAQASLDKLIASRDLLKQSAGGQETDYMKNFLEPEIAKLEKKVELLEKIEALNKTSTRAPGHAPRWTAEDQEKLVAARDKEIDRLQKLAEKEGELSEFKVTARHKEMTAMEKYYDDLDKLTQTHAQREGAALAEKLVALDEWRGTDLEKEAEYQQRRLAIIEEAGLVEIDINEIKSRRITDDSMKGVTELTEFQKNMARGTQDIIYETITGGFDEGIEGALKAFAAMLLKMEAQALAAQWTKWLFGVNADSGGGASSSFLGALFGGFKADGGPVSAGMGYVVGEEGPEFFSPSSSGFITPNHALGGSSSNITVYVQPTFNNMRDVTDAKMMAYGKQISDLTIARIRDNDRRGR